MPEQLDRFDREIIEFVLQWIPFGGPADDEVFPRFGMTRRQLDARFESIVRRAISLPRNSIDELLIHRVVFVCGWDRFRCTPYEDEVHGSDPDEDARVDGVPRDPLVVAPAKQKWRDEHGIWRWR